MTKSALQKECLQASVGLKSVNDAAAQFLLQLVQCFEEFNLGVRIILSQSRIADNVIFIDCISEPSPVVSCVRIFDNETANHFDLHGLLCWRR